MSLIFDRKIEILDNIFRYPDSNLAKSKSDLKSTRPCLFILAEAGIGRFLKLSSIVALFILEIKNVIICKDRKEVI